MWGGVGSKGFKSLREEWPEKKDSSVESLRHFLLDRRPIIWDNSTWYHHMFSESVVILWYSSIAWYLLNSYCKVIQIINRSVSAFPALCFTNLRRGSSSRLITRIKVLFWSKLVVVLVQLPTSWKILVWCYCDSMFYLGPLGR